MYVASRVLRRRERGAEPAVTAECADWEGSCWGALPPSSSLPLAHLRQMQALHEFSWTPEVVSQPLICTQHREFAGTLERGPPCEMPPQIGLHGAGGGDTPLPWAPRWHSVRPMDTRRETNVDGGQLLPAPASKSSGSGLVGLAPAASGTRRLAEALRQISGFDTVFAG